MSIDALHTFSFQKLYTNYELLLYLLTILRDLRLLLTIFMIRQWQFPEQSTDMSWEESIDFQEG